MLRAIGLTLQVCKIAVDAIQCQLQTVRQSLQVLFNLPDKAAIGKPAFVLPGSVTLDVAKFGPVGPGETVVGQWQLSDDIVRFEIRAAARAVASGRCRLAALTGP